LYDTHDRMDTDLCKIHYAKTSILRSADNQISPQANDIHTDYIQRHFHKKTHSSMTSGGYGKKVNHKNAPKTLTTFNGC